ncbi:MAG: hypothetical protein HY456_02295 [Parcubacteria group bacterium]|nr:hypothetical protein [Parcubacteria group bacterium]
MPNKRLYILIIVLVVVIIATVGVLVSLLASGKSIGGEQQYYAVYLRTGDLYFGRFKWGFSKTLTDVWLIQPSGNKDNPLSINKFENVFWQPTGDLILNQDEIVWIAPLKPGSDVAKLIKGELQAGSGQAPAAPPAQKQQ